MASAFSPGSQLTIEELLDHGSGLPVPHLLDGIYAELGRSVQLQQIGKHAGLELILAIFHKWNLTGISLTRQCKQECKWNWSNP
jgi:hypothetical protein